MNDEERLKLVNYFGIDYDDFFKECYQVNIYQDMPDIPMDEYLEKIKEEDERLLDFLKDIVDLDKDVNIFKDIGL